MYCDMVLEQKGDPNEPNEVFQDSWGTRAQGAPGISLRSGHWILLGLSENVCLHSYPKEKGYWVSDNSVEINSQL